MKAVQLLVKKIVAFAKNSKSFFFTSPNVSSAKTTQSGKNDVKKSTTASTRLKKNVNKVKIASNSKFEHSTFALLNFNFEKSDDNNPKESPTSTIIIATTIALMITVATAVVCFLVTHTI